MINKIAWLEGMALLPHHFQQSEKYIESMLQAKISSIYSNLYGFTSLVVDSYALSNGVFSVQKCKGLFPSGIYFESNDSNALIESRSIGDLFPAEKDTLDVFLAAPLFEESKANLSTEANNSSALHSLINLSVPDVNTGNNPKNIAFSKLNLKIVFEGEQLTGYEVLKVAELTRNMQSQIEISESFIPVTLSLNASQGLITKLKKIIDRATEKQTWLIGQNLVLSGENISSCMLLGTLNQFLPVLNSYYINLNSSSEVIYLKLLEFAGALCITNPVMRSSELPVYNHAGQQHCFDSVCSCLLALLESSVELSYELFKMKQATTGEYEANIANANPAAYGDVFIAIDSPLDTETLVQQVKQIGRAAPKDKLKSLVISALPGLTMEYLLNPPLRISPKPEKTYFTIATNHPLWSEVVSSRTFAMHLPQSLSVTSVEFIGLKA